VISTNYAKQRKGANWGHPLFMQNKEKEQAAEIHDSRRIKERITLVISTIHAE
jgi:hypothetical protein